MSTAKFSASLQAALAAALHQIGWGSIFVQSFGSSGIRLRCKRDPNASAADPWATGTEFLNIALAGPFTVDPATADVIVQSAPGITLNSGVDLTTGACVFRIEMGNYSSQGTVGLAGSGAGMIFGASPSGTSGFVISSMRIRAPLSLPFNASNVAVGGTLTNVTFQNTATSALTNQLVTFGHVFKQGEMQASDAAISLVGSTTIPAQIDVKATHPDRSVRHAVISAVVPALAASSSATYNITRVAKATSTPAVPADFAGLDAVATITEGGVSYSASLAPLLTAAPAPWLSGNVASEWHFSSPFKNSSGTAHAAITARFYVRGYKGSGKARVDVVLENCSITMGQSNATKHSVYDLTISVGGTQVFSASSVVHLPYTRTRRAYWFGGAAPTIHVRHNSQYVMDTKATPYYDPALINATEPGTEAGYLSTITAQDNALFNNGVAAAYMPTTGGRSDIGLIPGWDVCYLLGMTEGMRKVSFRQTDLMGSYSVHARDTATGQPLCSTDYPGQGGPATETVTITGVSATNPAVVTCAGHRFVPGMVVTIGGLTGSLSGANYTDFTIGAVTPTTFELVGLSGVGATYTGGGTATASNACFYEGAHVPSVYLAYLMSGDFYHLEETQFYAVQQAASFYGEYMYQRQSRNQAWGLRDYAHVAYISPDTDPLKAKCAKMLSDNLTDYNTRFADNPSANPLGALTGGSAWSDPDSNGLVTRTWQDDFFTQSLGHILELGFTQAAKMFAFKSKYVLGRMNYCRMLSCSYNFHVRPSGASEATYNTFAEMFAASFPVDYPQAGSNILAQVFDSAAMAAQAGPTNFETIGANSIVGYPDSALGYVANMQPALAYTVTHGITNGTAMWAKYQGRAVKQSHYDAFPEFAIVPRP